MLVYCDSNLLCRSAISMSIWHLILVLLCCSFTRTVFLYHFSITTYFYVLIKLHVRTFPWPAHLDYLLLEDRLPGRFKGEKGPLEGTLNLIPPR